MKKPIWQMAVLGLLIAFCFTFTAYAFVIGMLTFCVVALTDFVGMSRPKDFAIYFCHVLFDGLEGWVKFIGICYSWVRNQSRVVQSSVAVGLCLVIIGIVWYLFSGDKPVENPTNAASTIISTAVAIPYPDLVPVPLGAERYKMTIEQLHWRAEKMIETRTFWIMREGDAVKGAERVTSSEYQTYIKAAAALYSVPAEDIEAIHYLESFGSKDAQSPTGPLGPGQFTRRTASNIGPVKDGKCLLRFKRIPCGDPLPEKLPEVVEDNRKDTELSVYATAKLLSQEKTFFGDMDFVYMAYHSSREDVRLWIKKYLDPKPTGLGGKQDIQKYGLTYAQLYFGSTPYVNPGTYVMYRTGMQKDWGPNYPWKIRSSKNHLVLFRKDKAAFVRLSEENKFRGKRAKYRMWTFYREDDKALLSLDDLKGMIKSGDLVTIPQDSAKFGFKLRLQGMGMIAELDKQNVQHYIATKRETAGVLLWIAQELQRLRGAKSFDLEVTSVSRTVEYQNKLTKKNSTATKELSFHVLGLAFDVAKNQLTVDQERDLRFVLDELDSTGMISWVPENNAYHIVVAPDATAKEFFTRVYNDAVEFKTATPLVVDSNWF